MEARTRPEECITYSVSEAARVAGVSKTCMYELIRRGENEFPVTRMGRRVRVSRLGLERYLNGETR